MITALFSIIAGLLLLVKGADWLVTGASSLASRLGIRPIVIGLTVVAFGTSAPELIVNLFAAFGGSVDIAIGNIIGSNIANILLILGISALVHPLIVKGGTVWKEIPFALLAMVLVWLMANDILIAGGAANILDRIDGFVYMAFFIIFLFYTYGISKTDGKADPVELLTLRKTIFLVSGGLVALILGGKLTVDGAVVIAQFIGITERVIGLTVIAIGTSLPELVTSVVASYRSHADIAIGNVVGSNIFNVFWILGVSAVIRPLPFSAQNSFDTLIAIAATGVLLLAMFIGKRHTLERWQGGAFIFGYVAYLGFVLFT